MNNKLQSLKQELENEIKEKEKILNIFSYSRLLFFILALAFYIIAAYKHSLTKTVFYILAGVFTIAFIVVVIIHAKKAYKTDYLKFMISSINDYELRRENKFQRFKDGGEEFIDESNYYEYDLDLFGKSSVYKYLNVARTGYGRRAFAYSLKDKDIKEEEIIKRQEAVKELALDEKTHIELEAISRMYEKKVDDRRAISMDNALNLIENEQVVPSYEIFIALISNILVVLSIILAICKILAPTYIVGAIVISFVLNTFIATSIKPIRKNLIPINNLFSGYDLYIDYISKKDFKSQPLKDIKEELIKGNAKEIKRFNILNGFILSGNNILFEVIFNGLLALDTYLAIIFAKWQKKYAKTIRSSVVNVGDLEAYLSLSSINLIRDDVVLPKVSKEFKFKDLKHPLISLDKVIGNDFVFSDTNIITGSNMSGKTTFMRSIGINYLLFKAGGYVVAKEFEASTYKLFTSMKVSDDVSDGISTFYAEILRVKAIIEYAKTGSNMLVLIDEIFKGTNTKDRLVGAEAVVKHLRRSGIKSIITTHDMELCFVEGVCNYHFLEHYEDDKILFDYKIHDGISTTRNAIYLLKLSGIIEEEENK